MIPHKHYIGIACKQGDDLIYKIGCYESNNRGLEHHGNGKEFLFIYNAREIKFHYPQHKAEILALSHGQWFEWREKAPK